MESIDRMDVLIACSFSVNSHEIRSSSCFVLESLWGSFRELELEEKIQQQIVRFFILLRILGYVLCSVFEILTYKYTSKF